MRKKYNTGMAIASILVMVALVFVNIGVYSTVNNFKDKYDAVSYERTYIAPRQLRGVSNNELSSPTAIRFLFLDVDGEEIPMDNDTRLEYFEVNTKVQNYVETLNLIGGLFFAAACLGIILSLKDKYNITGLTILAVLGLIILFVGSFLKFFIVPIILIGALGAYLAYISRFVDWKGNVFLTFK
ncbi:hypothetical protein RJG79_01835 [Mycoplasmatota bacterium WC44]